VAKREKKAISWNFAPVAPELTVVCDIGGKRRIRNKRKETKQTEKSKIFSLASSPPFALAKSHLACFQSFPFPFSAINRHSITRLDIAARSA
jgi:hypothetical protein